MDEPQSVWLYAPDKPGCWWRWNGESVLAPCWIAAIPTDYSPRFLWSPAIPPAPPQEDNP